MKPLENFGTDIEIFEFAIAREIEANQLYNLLADKVESPEIKSMFVQLAEQELEHKEKLELEILKLGRVVNEMKPLPSELQQIELQDDIDFKDILVFAIGKERDSFRIYVDLSQIVHDSKSRELLLQLAEEEAVHKAKFEIELENFLSD